MTPRVFVAVLLALFVFFSVGAVIAILATGGESREEPKIRLETAPRTTTR